MASYSKLTDDLLDSHPTTETRIRHSSDMRLRDHGFEVTDRPDVGPNLWRKGKHGKSITEAFALILCDKQDQAKLREG